MGPHTIVFGHQLSSSARERRGGGGGGGFYHLTQKRREFAQFTYTEIGSLSRL